MKLFFLVCFTIFTSLSYAALPSQAGESFSAQMNIAKNSSQPMGARWKALLLASDLATSDQIDEIREFTKSSEWFMRNAAMTALNQVAPDYGIDAAKKLISDKALVVRSAAIELIATKPTIENRHLLAAELSKPYNFNGRKSLWIRSKIVQHLADRATADDRTFFSRELFDRDPEIAEIAAQTLEKITNVNFTGDQQLARWKTYIKAKNWN